MAQRLFAEASAIRHRLCRRRAGVRPDL